MATGSMTATIYWNKTDWRYTLTTGTAISLLCFNFQGYESKTIASILFMEDVIILNQGKKKLCPAMQWTKID
jgi:hypothetical protein